MRSLQSIKAGNSWIYKQNFPVSFKLGYQLILSHHTVSLYFDWRFKSKKDDFSRHLIFVLQLFPHGNRVVFNCVESNFAFALVLHYYALWLVNKTRATFSTNGKPNQNQSRFGRTRFPALGASYMYLLRILIGSLCCLHLLRLATVITLALVLQHSVENRSMVHFIDSHQSVLSILLFFFQNKPSFYQMIRSH